MLDLHKRVLGDITLKEIIGAQPPAIPDTRDMLASELDVLLEELKHKNDKDVSRLLQEQKEAEGIVNSRPGAMALAQDKIRLFNEYSNKYTDVLSFMHAGQGGVSNNDDDLS